VVVNGSHAAKVQVLRAPNLCRLPRGAAIDGPQPRPPDPLAQTTFALTALTPRNEAVVPLACGTHVCPLQNETNSTNVMSFMADFQYIASGRALYSKIDSRGYMRPIAVALFTAALATAGPPTFYKDVLPVLQQRCQECHRAGEVGPMPLLTYADARPWAKAVKEAVLQHKMPPWSADPHYGKFSNDRSLTAAEIDTLVAWADSGAKPGNPHDARPAVAFAAGWTIGKPDMVLDTGVDFKVPAKGTVEYTYFVVPTGFTEDKWVKDIEVRPGNRAVVHHIVLYARPKGSKFVAKAKPGEPFVPVDDDDGPQKERPPQDDKGFLYGINSGGFEMVGVYVPGGVAYRTLEGQARLIPAGADLIFQMHYTANGKEGLDRSKVGIVFANGIPTERVVNTFIANTSIRIPPDAAAHQVNAKVTLQQEAKLQAVFPHMHLRGKAFEYTATWPSGEKETLLKVPKYDFNWQITYYLAKPIILPKGTQLEATAVYDNSRNNPWNPDHAKEVYWGDQSWDEMLAGFVDLAIPVGMDPVDLVKPKKNQPVAALR
jgi:mono/diheme cytochrome c family protein